MQFISLLSTWGPFSPPPQLLTATAVLTLGSYWNRARAEWFSPSCPQSLRGPALGQVGSRPAYVPLAAAEDRAGGAAVTAELAGPGAVFALSNVHVELCDGRIALTLVLQEWTERSAYCLPAPGMLYLASHLLSAAGDTGKGSQSRALMARRAGQCLMWACWSLDHGLAGTQMMTAEGEDPKGQSPYGRDPQTWREGHSLLGERFLMGLNTHEGRLQGPHIPSS